MIYFCTKLQLILLITNEDYRWFKPLIVYEDQTSCKTYPTGHRSWGRMIFWKSISDSVIPLQMLQAHWSIRSYVFSNPINPPWSAGCSIIISLISYIKILRMDGMLWLLLWCGSISHHRNHMYEPNRVRLSETCGAAGTHSHIIWYWSRCLSQKHHFCEPVYSIWYMNLPPVARIPLIHYIKNCSEEDFIKLHNLKPITYRNKAPPKLI